MAASDRRADPCDHEARPRRLPRADDEQDDAALRSSRAPCGSRCSRRPRPARTSKAGRHTRALVVRAGRLLSPFGRHAGALVVGHEPLAGARRVVRRDLRRQVAVTVTGSDPTNREHLPLQSHRSRPKGDNNLLARTISAWVCSRALLLQAGRGRREPRASGTKLDNIGPPRRSAGPQLVREGALGLRDRSGHGHARLRRDLRTHGNGAPAGLRCWQPLPQQRRGPGRPQAARRAWP